ncbi:MAG: hypothetical protein KJZ65_03730 [Phycisphaerales bacterium]|nr:hypothetical protein [Phycisphaerales bacterium]
MGDRAMGDRAMGDRVMGDRVMGRGIADLSRLPRLAVAMPGCHRSPPPWTAQRRERPSGVRE